MASRKSLLICAAAYAMLSPIMADAATSPTLYGLAKRAGGADELFTYDLNQDFSLGYHASSLAPLDESPFNDDIITAITVGGSTLYALAKRAGGADELFTYDLNQDFSLGYHASSLAPLDESPFNDDIITAIAISLPASDSAAVPELSTWAYMLAGFGLLGLFARRGFGSKLTLA